MRYSLETNRSIVRDVSGIPSVPREPNRLLTIETVNDEFPITTYEQWKSERHILEATPAIFKSPDSERLNSPNTEIVGLPSAIQGSSTMKSGTSTHPLEGRDQCAICLDILEPNDIVRALKCFHCFHQECIDPWLTSRRGECPLCKRDYYQSPISEDRLSQLPEESTAETRNTAESHGTARVVRSQEITGREHRFPRYSFMQERSLQRWRSNVEEGV